MHTLAQRALRSFANISRRPDTTACLIHPFFWDQGQRLSFLQDASDRFEIMCRDPRDARLVTLETGAVDVVGNDWHSRLDKVFIDNLGKYRKYDGKSVQDLMRALRNKVFHLYITSCFQQLTRHAETPLPRLAGQCQTPFRAHARRLPLIFYSPLSTLIPPCLHCCRQHIITPRKYV